MMNHFSKRQAISDGWHIFWQNWKLLLLVIITLFVCQILPSVFSSFFPEDSFFVNLVIMVLFFLINSMVLLGSSFIYLSLVDGKQVSYTSLFSQLKLLGWYILGGIVLFVILLIGYLLLIIPGIILSIRLQFWIYCMIDAHTNGTAAIGKSWQITKGNTGNLFLFGILLGLILLAGTLVFGIGLLVAIPVVGLATARMYRALSVPQESSVQQVGS